MLDHHDWALKEWAVVCAALAAGRQTLLLRKGGIDEGPAGFQVQQSEFWLLPTRFHQSPDELQPGDAALMDSPSVVPPPGGELRIELYARCERVLRLSCESDLETLIPLQVLSRETVRERFHYRRPGLFGLVLRVFRAPMPITLSNDPAYDGCHSWVQLKTPLPTAGLVPVLTNQPFAAVCQRLDEVTRNQT